MKNLMKYMVIIAMIAGMAAATPLDAVQNAGIIEHGMVDLQNLNPTVFNSQDMNATTGVSNGLNDSNNIDLDAQWKVTANDFLNTTL